MVSNALNGKPSAINGKKDNILSFELMQNYPNPFNPDTKIAFNLPFSAETTLKVYNILGQETAVIFLDKMMAKGYHEANFDASSARGGLNSGVYLYQLTAGEFVSTKKMILLR